MSDAQDLDALVAHRRLLDLGPNVRPIADTAFFDRIGGQATIDAIVDGLYDRFARDEAIRPFFGGGLTAGRLHQKRFFAEWLGGPARYSESAWGGLHGHHEDLPITPPVSERWLDHLRVAVAAAVLDDGDGAFIVARAGAVARALVNTEDAPATAAASKHRSARAASCGVGARTVSEATSLSRRGKMAELAALVADVPDLIGRGPFQAQLLRAASLAGRAEVVTWLLDHGADVDAPAPLPVGLVGGALELVLFATPLAAARLTGRDAVADLLVARGAKHDVFTAALLGDIDRLEVVLAGRPELAQIADPATDVVVITPIHHAIAGGHLLALRALLDRADEPVRTGGRALRAAAERGSRDMVELVLDHGADARAIGAGRWVLDVRLAGRLVQAGASAGVGAGGEDSGDWVRISCTGNQRRRDDPDFVAALLRCGARVDQRYNGATALHYVVKAGFVQTVRLLLAHGADRDALDDRGRTPLDWLDRAARSVDRSLVRVALGSGSD